MPLMRVRDLPDCIRDAMVEAEYDDCTTPEEWFRRWLEWEGIVGYHDDILSAVRELGIGGE